MKLGLKKKNSKNYDGLRVLAADNEPYVRDFYHKVLTERGHDVTLAEDGGDCLRKYALEFKEKSGQPMIMPYDIVIMDYSMPHVDGLTAVKKLLSIQPHQRIIFATAFGTDLVRESKILPRSIELLEKPFSLHKLVSAVENSRGVVTLGEKENSRGKVWNTKKEIETPPL